MTMPRRSLAGCIFLSLLLIVPGALPAAPAPAGAPARPAPKPPTLESSLSAGLKRKCLSGARVGVAVASVADGRIVFERNPLLPLTPASTLKVLTTAAALDRLGPEFRYETLVFTDGVLNDGVLKGNLYLRGSGAPDLVVERWRELAAGLASLGMREISGSVVGDESYFDAERRPPGWPAPRNTNPYNAPISALSANFNTVEVRVLPSRPGQKPVVVLEPRSDLVRADNRARTGQGTALRLGRSFDGAVNTVVVRGTIGSRSPGRREWIVVEDPARVAAAVLAAALEEAGVTVAGGASLGVTPPEATLIYSFASKPLAEIVSDANKNSNNFVSECLQRTLGAVGSGPPGSREKGAQALLRLVQDSGGPLEGLHLVDGSGLSSDNRLTARALVAVLLKMAADPRSGAPFLESLPASGVDGTLRHRLTDVAGRIRGKTGTIGGVKALAGYAVDAGGRPVFAFAILVNGYHCSERGVVAAMDELARALVRWTPPAAT